MIRASICLSDITKELIKEGKNGKKYLDIVIDSRKEADTYGNTHTVYISQSKEQREAKEPKKYLGNGKEYTFNQQQPAQQPVYNYDPNNPPVVDDLPF